MRVEWIDRPLEIAVPEPDDVLIDAAGSQREDPAFRRREEVRHEVTDLHDRDVMTGRIETDRVKIPNEVVRLAASSFLTYQIAEVIMKTGQWMANLDVRLALIRNPKTPQAFSLRILPTLPDSEIRAIARAGTSMALKQAALRRLQSKA